MKFRFVLLLVVVVISLSACADAAVSFNLADDNSLNIIYSLKVTTEEDISRSISLIKAYWTDMGFLVDDSKDNGVYTLNGDKSVNFESRGSAVKEFSSILTDKNSLFSDVRFTYTPSYFEDLYDFSANISLKDIIRKSEESNIPAAEIESFISGAENSVYRLSITLPGKVQETNADEQNGQTCTWLLKYGEEREIKLSTKRVFEDHVSNYENLTETQERDNLLFIISGGAAGFLFLITIIIVAVRSARTKRSRSEINVERF